jgi:hypothetical protein
MQTLENPKELHMPRLANKTAINHDLLSDKGRQTIQDGSLRKNYPL